MTLNVSHETEARLKHYLFLLQKWQKAINLVSPKTIETAWERHILDSLQLTPYIDPNSKVFDFGSGAGFPGLVLAITRPDLKVSLFEADGRKCSFMKAVLRETGTTATVINERIEDTDISDTPDFITARALAPLKDLLGLSLRFAQANPSVILLFLKGEDLPHELQEAKESFDFESSHIPSLTAARAHIIKVKALCIRQYT